MTVLRLEAVAGNAIDRALAAVGTLTLVRRPDGAFADVREQDAAPLIRALALAGIAAVPSMVDLAPPSGTHAAVGRDLAPFPGLAISVDLLEVRRVPVGEATRASLARRLPRLRRPSRAQRERCDALLRERDVALAWRRRAWASRAALRSGAARVSLRPVVFDPDALTREEERTVLASAGLIGRWLF